MMEKVDKSKHVWFGLRWNAALSNDSAIPLKTPYDKFYKYFVDKMAYNVDGTPVTYFQDFDKKTQQPDGWKQTSPGTITVENCVLCEADTRKWHDYNCDTTTGFSLCRKMASTQPD
uniref:C-type lectin domain-containing protein n=1 Tax=Panagrolaimus superbus TaxID=310955 RepID=A0A914ZCM8_9BILA